MILYTLYFLVGLAIGSFLNVVIDRLEIGESVIRGRSYCPKCRTILRWYDLIPLFSFLILKGRCRYCEGKISWQYPTVEIATALLFLLIPNSQFLFFLYYLVITCFLIIIFVYDLKHYIIPDKVIYPAILVVSACLILKSIGVLPAARDGLFLKGGLQEGLLSAFLAAGFFFLLVAISKGQWMGLGDVKLAFLMGLILGWPEILLALFFSFLSGALVGLSLIAAGSKTLKSQIPFGPFLSASTIFIILFGKQIIDWLMEFIV